MYFFDGALVSRDPVVNPVLIETITPAILREMLEYGRTNGVTLELASLNGFYAECETWSTRAKQEFFGIDTTIAPFDGILESEHIVRIDIAVADDGYRTAVTGFTERFGEKASFSRTFSPRYPGVEFVNVVSLGLSKGKALASLCRHLGYVPADVMAVGDWLNDITMLEFAGFGVAMGNAHEDVKSIADYVTLDVHEHGLAEAVRKYILRS